MLSSTSSHASVQMFSGNCCFPVTVFSAKNKAAANHVVLNSHTSSNVCFCVVPFIWIFKKPISLITDNLVALVICAIFTP